MPRKEFVRIEKCRVCDKDFPYGRSFCPHCGTPVIVYESEEFIKFEVEIERSVWRAIDHVRGELTISAWIEKAIQEQISIENKEKAR